MLPQPSPRHLFTRTWSIKDGSRYTTHISDGCGWVLEGRGVPFIKFDGWPVLILRNKVYKLAKKRQRWERADQPKDWRIQNAFLGRNYGGWGERRHAYAWHHHDWPTLLGDCTYELIGSEIKGNVYRVHANSSHNYLVPHNFFKAPTMELKRFSNGYRSNAIEGLYEYLFNYMEANGWSGGSPLMEGVVWWRDPYDFRCEKVQVTRQGFGLPWPPLERT